MTNLIDGLKEKAREYIWEGREPEFMADITHHMIDNVVEMVAERVAQEIDGGAYPEDIIKQCKAVE